MKRNGFYSFCFVLLALLNSCKDQSALKTQFNCDLSDNMQKVCADYKKLFELKVPEQFKINLFYNENHSDIAVADTTRQLTSSLILDVSYFYKSEVLNDTLIRQWKMQLENRQLVVTEEKDGLSNPLPSYWILAEGTDRGYDFHQFEQRIYLETGPAVHARISVYGNTNVNERLCEGIQIIESLNFLK